MWVGCGVWWLCGGALKNIHKPQHKPHHFYLSFWSFSLTKSFIKSLTKGAYYGS
ncbi:hypothetical protein [Moraxella lacunata]|uniref:hypothetical protein n=1 Tax=Moraxella lacunata TaxID=477 RepID=UPI003EE0D1CF